MPVHRFNNEIGGYFWVLGALCVYLALLLAWVWLRLRPRDE
jgi:hypothetical protein